jgi:hypothetical protein
MLTAKQNGHLRPIFRTKFRNLEKTSVGGESAKTCRFAPKKGGRAPFFEMWLDLAWFRPVWETDRPEPWNPAT